MVKDGFLIKFSSTDANIPNHGNFSLGNGIIFVARVPAVADSKLTLIQTGKLEP